MRFQPFLILSASLCFNLSPSVEGQGLVSVFESGGFGFTSVPGHHIDRFNVNAAGPIRLLNAAAGAAPLHHENPLGQATVFASDIDPGLANRDSHFLFDTSSATVLLASENASEIRTSVVFNANYPTSFPLAQLVAPDGHAPYWAEVSGELLDGRPFSASIFFVPEPSTYGLLAIGLSALLIRRKCVQFR